MINYIDAKTFGEFKCNQEEMIDVLNHNMTKVQVDIGWIKKMGNVMAGLMTGIFMALLAGVIKLFMN